MANVPTPIYTHIGVKSSTHVHSSYTYTYVNAAREPCMLGVHILIHVHVYMYITSCVEVHVY